MQIETKNDKEEASGGVGKRVGDNIYVHVSALTALSQEQQLVIAQASELARVTPGEQFSVIKLSQQGSDLSLLDYPNFFEDPFPTLARSWRVSLANKLVVFRDYQESRNPPILHRKELLLPIADPRGAEFALTTESADSLGLFDEPNRIGFREHWYRLIAERGYELVGGAFLPLANSTSSLSDIDPVVDESVQRHRTALSRYNFSAPVQALSRHGLIHPGVTFFDYGCGRGDDVRGLIANGIEATGWDPHFAPDAEKRVADCVNIGFVINVIEDVNERVEALRGAYAHARGVLAIAAMLTSQITPEGRQFRDGYISSRNTFQKYFTQAQLRDFVEHTLDTTAIAAGPGVFFVFRDSDLEQQFLSRRYGHRAPTILSRGWIRERPVRERVLRVNQETRLFEANPQLFEGLWIKLLELGRKPEKGEVENLREIEAIVGSLNRALRIAQARFDGREIERARAARTADILVLLAMQQFERRKPYRHLEAGLQRDIRTFFGDYSSAQALAKQALFDIGNAQAIDRACREAADKGLGWLEDSESLQLHISLIERLPMALRIYVSCATVLCGDISTFDLVKIHIRSGKVTLLKFEDFEKSPLPRLLERVKVKLRDQDMDVFTYGAEYPSTLLYRKSRYINEEFLFYSEQVAFEEKLEELKLFDFSGYGPPELEFRKKLEQSRWAIDGFNLIRSRRIPDIDEPCGANFTYRQLIECGETQARSTIPNLPKQADSYTALYELATNVLDPVIEYFGMIRLTYGFCSAEVAKLIPGRIAPKLDQHAAHEKNRNGKFICERLGAACDFIVDDEDMWEVSCWIYENIKFDRVYFYENCAPIHVSFGPDHKRELVKVMRTSTGRVLPQRIRIRT